MRQLNHAVLWVLALADAHSAPLKRQIEAHMFHPTMDSRAQPVQGSSLTADVAESLGSIRSYDGASQVGNMKAVSASGDFSSPEHRWLPRSTAVVVNADGGVVGAPAGKANRQSSHGRTQSATVGLVRVVGSVSYAGTTAQTPPPGAMAAPAVANAPAAPAVMTVPTATAPPLATATQAPLSTTPVSTAVPSPSEEGDGSMLPIIIIIVVVVLACGVGGFVYYVKVVRAPPRPRLMGHYAGRATTTGGKGQMSLRSAASALRNSSGREKQGLHSVATAAAAAKKEQPQEDDSDAAFEA